ncbi:hypothetical protein N7492_002927 [Penicillium capsulatum]|uniref:Uncharacterized protein n=1 Tax=Penicillium capsulatum TaxID=69766 RepID=A0A9W9IKX3_9EURO|nr:hypothetical protein N7492_002927 [Penicillium capsulatum]KAJ6122479.1 hypothetical protein N7512_004944 [Penicillium capsulatum]
MPKDLVLGGKPFHGKGSLYSKRSLYGKEIPNWHEEQPQDSSPKKGRGDIQRAPLLKRFNLSVQGPRHDHPDWAEIPEDIRDEPMVQTILTFPSLETPCTELLQDIQNNLLPSCQDMDYAEQVIAHGGIDKVTEELLAHVRPEVLDLQGKQITRGNLEKIRRVQNDDENWDDPIGYLDFITDDRSPEWLRYYVGQCEIAKRRLVNGHAQEALRASLSSLHYFIVWMGNGHRSMNFIRLWSVPRNKMDMNHWLIIKQNILESVFCKAFNSHFGVLDGRTAEACLQENFVPQNPSFGLNLMTPLAQGGFKLGFERSQLVQAANHSPDSQILYWLRHFCQKRINHLNDRKQRHLLAERPIFRADFERALCDALRDNALFRDIKASFTFEVEPQWQERPQQIRDSMPFFGTLSARVGFVLDYAAICPASGALQENPVGVPKFGIPWALRKCRFDDTNCLVWTFNFDHFLPLGMEALGSPKLKTNARHLELIKDSQARIIFLCGPRAEEAVRDSSMERFTLELRGFKYPIYLARVPSDSGITIRLFIRCPPIPSQIWSSSKSDSSKFSEGLRFAISLLRLKGIRGYSIETMTLLGTILSWARQEKAGKTPVGIDTMGFPVRLWLLRKGISEETLEKVQQLAGGSLARGLLMILGSLERRPCKRKRDPEDEPEHYVKKNRSDHGSFNPIAFQKVRRIVSSAQRDHENTYQKGLSDLPPEEVQESRQAKDDLLPHDVQDSAKVKNSLEVQEARQVKDNLLPHEFQDSAKVKNSLDESEVRQILTGTGSSTLKEQVRDLIHSQPEQDGDLKTDDEESEAPLDIELSELAPLCEDAMDQGILNPKISEARRFKNSSGYTWRKERVRFRNFEYRYQAQPDISRSGRTITLNRCHISIHQFEDIGDGTIWVRIEVSEPGQRHPHCYAPKALDSDPASRLAFRLRYQPSSGPEVVRFGDRSGFQAIYAGNTFLDILLEGKSYEEIAKIPRRYIFLGNLKECPDELKRFCPGAYTDGCDLTGEEDGSE